MPASTSPAASCHSHWLVQLARSICQTSLPRWPTSCVMLSMAYTALVKATTSHMPSMRRGCPADQHARQLATSAWMRSSKSRRTASAFASIACTHRWPGAVFSATVRSSSCAHRQRPTSRTAPPTAAPGRVPSDPPSPHRHPHPSGSAPTQSPAGTRRSTHRAVQARGQWAGERPTRQAGAHHAKNSSVPPSCLAPKLRTPGRPNQGVASGPPHSDVSARRT